MHRSFIQKHSLSIKKITGCVGGTAAVVLLLHAVPVPVGHYETAVRTANVRAIATSAENDIHRLSTETRPEPFARLTVESAKLTKGVTEIKTAGVNGVRTTTYELTLTNGIQTAKRLIKEEVTTPPIAQVTLIGTYEPPTTPVPMPAADPNGATAQCVDGTYSYSDQHSRACSGHKGVAIWYHAADVPA